MQDLELIKQKINIVDLIQEYLPLKKAGLNFKANCPFHGEKTPSFVVSPERGIWHCFGCDKGGDIFKFIMEKEGLEFKETIEILAQKAGITLKKESKIKHPSDRLYELHQKAQQFFQYMLQEHALGKKALAYLEKRGLKEETIKAFAIGYAPQNWEILTNFLKKRGFTQQELIDSGLAVPSNKGCYDRFRGRIMFPLLDVRNRIIGFSGRILEQGEPKYINSPQTLIFDKSQFLFGIHLSKQFIREKKEAILVEGELDMILSFQTGIKNVIATKGTALTEGQLSLLKKYTETLSLCFDTDLAGDAAARRGIELADQNGFNLKVIKLSQGKDPGELCLKNPQEWIESVKNATPIYDYYLESVARRYSPNTAIGKKQIFSELIPIWKKITDPISKEHYIQKLAALVQVKEDFIRHELENYKPATMQDLKHLTKTQPQDNQLSPKKDDTVYQKDRRRLLEEYLLALILHIPQGYTYVPNFPESLFTDESLLQLYILLVIYLDGISFKGGSFKITEFAKMVPSDVISLIDRLYLIEIDDKLSEPKIWQKEVDLVVHELKRMLIKASLEKLSLKIKNAQAFDKTETLAVLNKRFRDLSVKLKNL